MFYVNLQCHIKLISIHGSPLRLPLSFNKLQELPCMNNVILRKIQFILTSGQLLKTNRKLETANRNCWEVVHNRWNSLHERKHSGYSIIISKITL